MRETKLSFLAYHNGKSQRLILKIKKKFYDSAAAYAHKEHFILLGINEVGKETKCGGNKWKDFHFCKLMLHELLEKLFILWWKLFREQINFFFQKKRDFFQLRRKIYRIDNWNTGGNSMLHKLYFPFSLFLEGAKGGCEQRTERKVFLKTRVLI